MIPFQPILSTNPVRKMEISLENLYLDIGACRVKWQCCLFQVAMTAVTVGFVIGQATSTRQSPIYKAILDFDTGVQSKVVYIFTMFCRSQQQLVGPRPHRQFQPRHSCWWYTSLIPFYINYAPIVIINNILIM